MPTYIGFFSNVVFIFNPFPASAFGMLDNHQWLFVAIVTVCFSFFGCYAPAIIGLSKRNKMITFLFCLKSKNLATAALVADCIKFSRFHFQPLPGLAPVNGQFTWL